MGTYLKVKSSEIVMAILVFFFLLGVTPSWVEFWRAGTNPSQFFEVHQLYIPDMPAGENPAILYDRAIKTSFHGTWVAEVQMIQGSGFYSVCRGKGESNYSPQKALPDPLTLDWFMGTKCNLSPGKYRVEVIWNLSVPGYPNLQVTVVSNVFEVK